jgi:hypothetical protein
MTPLDGLQARLSRLQAERALLALEGLDAQELDADIAASRDAYVGEAVAAIAMLRADLSGPLVG